jgi:histidinol phosphatase-like enzyme
MIEMKKTLFIDIDGTLFKHQRNLSEMFIKNMEVLPGVIEKFNEWDAKGYKIILTTGRKECLRKITEEQLLKNGIFFDQLVMGLTRGERILINDIKPNNDMSVATAIQINRDEGLKNIEI